MRDASPRVGRAVVTATRRVLLVAVGLALVLGLESCDPPCLDTLAGVACSPPLPPTPNPTPPLCTQTPVGTSSGAVPARALIFNDFPVTEIGRLDLTLDWTNASSLMGLYLVPAGTCTLDEFNNRTCNFIVRSEPPGPKPRRVSANLQAGNYRFMVANYSSGDESAALQMTLSKGSCAAISSHPASGAANEGGLTLTVERVVHE